jgi:hypothetical protein
MVEHRARVFPAERPTRKNYMESTDVVLTQDQTNTLAERIAAVLRERKKVGAQRRMREREMQRRNSQRAAAPYIVARAPHFARLASVPPELRERCARRMQTIDAAYLAVTSSNAAFEALREGGEIS